MKDSFAIELRGWSCGVVSPDSFASDILGPQWERTEVLLSPGRWTVLDPLEPAQPVGAIKRLVVITASTPATVEIVPGSQGQSSPPPESLAAVCEVPIPAGHALAFDARLWCRVASLPALNAQLWTSAPSHRYGQ
jgi:hypothetical protein